VNKLLLLLFLLTLSPALLNGQTLAQIQHKQEVRLADALRRLSSQREQIRRNQIPLARELNTLENKLQALREEVEGVQSLRDSRSGTTPFSGIPFFVS